MRSVTAIAFVFATIASAQYSIDPNSVPESTRDTWCTNQQTSCPLLCTQIANGNSGTNQNTCDPDSLTYSCVCANGISPNASEYSQTLPYFICTEYDTQCVNNCNGDSGCQSACRSEHPCGAQDPTKYNLTTSSSMAATKTGSAASSTGSAGAVYTGLGGAPAATSSAGQKGSKAASAAVAAIDIGQSYGAGIIAVGIFAGFALML
ncbi:MAG: hypothetical protein M1827_005503 [Pycnora praestabilis]|nr:MAG: hypothetical protein M1827_005503 [Pycnora praestabilis]